MALLMLCTIATLVCLAAADPQQTSYSLVETVNHESVGGEELAGRLEELFVEEARLQREILNLQVKENKVTTEILHLLKAKKDQHPRIPSHLPPTKKPDVPEDDCDAILSQVRDCCLGNLLSKFRPTAVDAEVEARHFIRSEDVEHKRNLQGMAESNTSSLVGPTVVSTDVADMEQQSKPTSIPAIEILTIPKGPDAGQSTPLPNPRACDCKAKLADPTVSRCLARRKPANASKEAGRNCRQEKEDLIRCRRTGNTDCESQSEALGACVDEIVQTLERKEPVGFDRWRFRSDGAGECKGVCGNPKHAECRRCLAKLLSHGGNTG